MPVIDDERVSIFINDSDNGHTIHYSLVGLNFHKNDVLSMFRSYKTECPAFITLYKIGIKFQKESSSNTVSCMFSVKREDPLLCQTAVNFSIELFNANMESLSDPVSSRKTSILSGDAIEESFDQLISSEILSSNGEDMVVKITFNIYYCH
ncbi:hypothetical protein AVEN_38737-1 [Araneus ventricosus]|uniref:Uncharacterized protein n=1 Tax=Araneus ventricosus TaxID=182803 RepID=A0A4Y2FU18_ARAVE|nr:hypothetical protein AVEN_38737-1 [Araneus ventricosus]